MNYLTTKKTSLSSSKSVVETLNWKRSQLIEDKKQVAESIADYIGLAVEEIEGSIEHATNIKAVITEKIRELKEQKKEVLEGSAEFLTESGISRLDGTIISSITVTKGKAPTTKKVYTVIEDAKEVRKYLISAGLAVMEEVEVPAVPAKAKVNRRKILIGEVEDAAIN